MISRFTHSKIYSKNHPKNSLRGLLVDKKKLPVELQKEEPDELSWLEPSERYAYNYIEPRLRRGGSDTYPLAPSISDGMFQLYLQGRTLNEIRRINPQFSLGQIVHAAVEGHWNLQRDAWVALSMARAKARAVLAAADGVEMAADMMAAFRRLHGETVSKFLQSGRVEDLGTAININSIRQLKEISEILMRLTGQDQKKSLSGVVEVKHSGGIITVPVTPPKVLDTTEASGTLAAWAAVQKKKIEDDLK
jgi:hypothetical protein